MADKTLTRNEFYKLAHECRDYALRLATYDQATVNRELCREFNEFLPRVRGYDRLEAPLQQLRPARPITRGMVLAATVVILLLLTVILGRTAASPARLLLIGLGPMLILLVYFTPPGVYGATVEMIEGRVLVVVQAMQQLLESGQMGFSEAAYFVARDVLREAADELRQQVYLVNAPRWRG